MWDNTNSTDKACCKLAECWHAFLGRLTRPIAMQTDGGGPYRPVLGQMSMRGEVFGLIPPNSISRRLHVCWGDSSIGWGVLYALCNRSTISKSVQTRFLKLLGMLSTSCKYRYQNIIHIKKHSTLKNLVLEILVLYTKFNILLSLENIFVRWYRVNKNNPINCINCII